MGRVLGRVFPRAAVVLVWRAGHHSDQPGAVGTIRVFSEAWAITEDRADCATQPVRAIRAGVLHERSAEVTDWYNDPERIERIREQDVELRLLTCPGWDSIVAEYRRAYDLPEPIVLQPARVLLWSALMIQRALRLGKDLRTNWPERSPHAPVIVSGPAADGR